MKIFKHTAKRLDSMPDTVANQEQWPQQRQQKEGCGFPTARICACFSLATGGLLGFELGNKKSAPFRTTALFLATVSSIAFGIEEPSHQVSKPNVVIIYADDLGYGDVGCYDSRSKIPTPNIDQLAEKGIRFTNAHASDTICSPSRYGILTGRYSWRTSLKHSNPPPGIQPWLTPGRLTMPQMLKNQGYDTAAIGKWGLGTDWSDAAKPGRKGLDLSAEAIDYSKPAYSGRPFGFTYENVHLWYGLSVFRKQYPCNKAPDAHEKCDGGRWYFENGMSRGGNPDFSAFDMEAAQMYYIKRTVEFIDAKGGALNNPAFNIKDNAPFFIYYCPTIPHWPHVPAKQFQGKTTLGYYGDFVHELDWAVGQIVEALERNGFGNNTLIIFASDNGPEYQTYELIKEHDHFSMGPWRGLKRDLWEGGHRTPFIVSWPGVAPQGKTTDRLVSQTDLFATLADYLAIELPEDAAEDSFSFLDEMIPQREVTVCRDITIHHSFKNQYALRKGNWVFVDAPSGGDRKEPKWLAAMRKIKPHTEPFELFDLASDPGQSTNVYAQYPEKAKALQALLNQYKSSGRTRK